MKVLAFLGLLLAVLVSPALAGDWVAVKLRGKVFELVDGEWQPLRRGDVVSDDRMIRTVGNGRVTFAKDDQTIDFGAETAGQIVDFANGEKTTVWHHFGTVAVVADERMTEHFSVQTQFLAAVVKGTKFSVTTDDRGSLVEVTRGQVAVTDTERDATVQVRAGEIAAVGPERPLATFAVEVADELLSDGGVTSAPFVEIGERDGDETTVDDGPITAPYAGDADMGDTKKGHGNDNGEPGEGADDDADPHAGDNNNGHGNDDDGLDEGNPGRSGDDDADTEVTPDPDTGDNNNGHGNDDDGLDEGNPGRSGDDADTDVTPDPDTGDNNRGHGNDDDGIDEDNPGKSGGKKG